MELFFNNKEYKDLKSDYEKTCFKLIGKYCINTGDKILEKSASEISEYFKNKKITLEIIEQQTTKKGTTISTTKEITKNFYQIWSEDPDMKEYLEIVFNCDINKIKPSQYNLFDNFKHLDTIEIKDKIDLEPVFEHIKSLVNYNELHFKYVISWFAQLIQQPHILPHTTLIFISEEGVGKDLFSNFISEVINDNYCFNTEKLESMCGKFNSILGGKLLATINETNPVESRERIENIKYIITADKVWIEGKHKDPIKTQNFCRFMFFSNRLFAFPIEDGSRRPVIFQSSSKYLPVNYGIDENKKYFSKLANIYKNKEYQKSFLEYLKAYDITNFNPKEIVKSELHQELEENSLSPIVGYLSEIVKMKNGIFKMTTKETYENFLIYVKSQNLKYELSPTKFNVEMTSTYKIKKIKNSNNYFEFDSNDLKKFLTEKYKLVFDDVENDETKNDVFDNDLIIANLKNENSELKNKLKELEAQLLKLQSPKKEEMNQVLKIEEITDDDLEALERELEEVNKMTKPKEERFYLTLPFTSKEDVKRNGAKYDSDKKEWYVLKTNPKFQYLTVLYKSHHVIKTRRGLEFVGYGSDTNEYKFIEECKKELGIIEEEWNESESEPKQEQEVENKFDEDDIKDVLDFIDNSKKSKKNKKTKK
jgi:hypothetical protein